MERATTIPGRLGDVGPVFGLHDILQAQANPYRVASKCGGINEPVTAECEVVDVIGRGAAAIG